jgi:hypothetical protein
MVGIDFWSQVILGGITMALMCKRKHCTSLRQLKWDKPVVNQAVSQGNQCQDIGDALTKDFQSSRKGKNHAQNIDNNLTTKAKKNDLEIFCSQV